MCSQPHQIYSSATHPQVFENLHNIQYQRHLFRSPKNSYCNYSKSNMALLNQKLLLQSSLFSKKRLSQDKLQQRKAFEPKYKQTTKALNPEIREFLKIQQKLKRKSSISKYKITSPILGLSLGTESKKSQNNYQKSQKSQYLTSSSQKVRGECLLGFENDEMNMAYIEARKQMQNIVFVAQSECSDDNELVGQYQLKFRRCQSSKRKFQNSFGSDQSSQFQIFLKEEKQKQQNLDLEGQQSRLSSLKQSKNNSLTKKVPPPNIIFQSSEPNNLEISDTIFYSFQNSSQFRSFGE